ncbi:MAG: pyrroline-5-carboxylate reductase [Nitrososphaerota archaeon]|nr:pyrroline-5-carboxylate reductase [Nitrososphaerota archaeon]MDG6939265.1 pyrroline-5-carboxylate reductase [Nitrososphaerota archaeon]
MIVAVLGAGKIGEAMAQSLARSESVSKVLITRRNVKGLSPASQKIVVMTDNRKAVAQAEAVIVSVKASDAKRLLEEISGAVKGKLVISVMAAISLKNLEGSLPGAQVVRAMPNIAAKVAESVTAYVPGRGLPKATVERAREILACAGETVEVPEHLMDAVTALSGSGPAYIAILIDAMISAALKVGIPREIASKLVVRTLSGTAELIARDGMHPAELRDMVTTPAGTTIAGIYELEKGSLRTSIMNAVEAATHASERVSKRFEGGE